MSIRLQSRQTWSPLPSFPRPCFIFRQTTTQQIQTLASLAFSEYVRDCQQQISQPLITPNPSIKQVAESFRLNASTQASRVDIPWPPHVQLANGQLHGLQYNNTQKIPIQPQRCIRPHHCTKVLQMTACTSKYYSTSGHCGLALIPLRNNDMQHMVDMTT